MLMPRDLLDPLLPSYAPHLLQPKLGSNVIRGCPAGRVSQLPYSAAILVKRSSELIAGIEIIGEAAANHRHVGMIVEQERSTR